MYKIAIQVFLALAGLGLLGWIATKFTRPIFHIGPDGFLLWTLTMLAFVIALCLVQMTLQGRPGK